MCNVMFILQNKTKGIVMFNGQPALFDSDESAWDFILQTMEQEQHPAFMWIRKVVSPNANLAT
mgnify:CR=1 FL=1